LLCPTKPILTFSVLKKQVQAFRHIQHEHGLQLIQSRIQFFKDTLEGKASTEVLKELMHDDESNTTFDNTPYLAEL
jgi:hypothetical protein